MNSGDPATDQQANDSGSQPHFSPSEPSTAMFRPQVMGQAGWRDVGSAAGTSDDPLQSTTQAQNRSAQMDALHSANRDAQANGAYGSVIGGSYSFSPPASKTPETNGYSSEQTRGDELEGLKQVDNPTADQVDKIQLLSNPAGSSLGFKAPQYNGLR